MRISDWSSDVCSSDLRALRQLFDLRHRMAVHLATLRLPGIGGDAREAVAALAVGLGGDQRSGHRLGVVSGRSGRRQHLRSEEHTSELQSLMRISYAVFCLKKKNTQTHRHNKIQ